MILLSMFLNKQYIDKTCANKNNEHLNVNEVELTQITDLLRSISLHSVYQCSSDSNLADMMKKRKAQVSPKKAPTDFHRPIHCKGLMNSLRMNPSSMNSLRMNLLTSFVSRRRIKIGICCFFHTSRRMKIHDVRPKIQNLTVYQGCLTFLLLPSISKCPFPKRFCKIQTVQSVIARNF